MRKILLAHFFVWGSAVKQTLRSSNAYRFPAVGLLRAGCLTVDSATLETVYGEPEGQGRERGHRAAACIGGEKKKGIGKPNQTIVSTSSVGRQNPARRTHGKRFMQLTSAFSKKVENQLSRDCLVLRFYNVAKIHTSQRATPAMQAGAMQKPMTLRGIVNHVPEEEPTKSGAYKKKAAA